MTRRSTNPFGRPSYGELEKITEHCYIFRNTVNSGVILGEDAVAVVDTQINAPMARRLIRAIRTVTALPIRYAINTHYHWDHWAGNDVFAAEGATVVTGNLTREYMGRRHRRQRAFLKNRGFQMPESDPALPSITFDGKLELNLGKLPVHLEFIGRAETNDPTAVMIPGDRVIMAGDTVMTGSFPILGQPVMCEGMGEDRDWIRTLKHIRALDPVAVIPGHGPLGRNEDLESFIRLQEFLLDEVEQAVLDQLDQAASLERIVSRMPDEFRQMAVTWGTPEYAILRGLKTYTGWQHVKPSAIPEPAAADLEATLKTLETRASSYRDAADQMAREGKEALAIALLEEGTRAFAGDPAIWCDFGRILIQSSRGVSSVLEKGDFFFKARQALEKALEISPSHAPSMGLLGGYLITAAYQSGDDPETGLALVEKALTLDLEDVERGRAHFHRGLAHRAREDEARAIPDFHRALELDPGFMPARLALSDGAGPGRPGAGAGGAAPALRPGAGRPQEASR